jgi:hypothetical protein
MFPQAALASRLLPVLLRAPGYDPQPIDPGKARYTPFGCFPFTLANIINSEPHFSRGGHREKPMDGIIIVGSILLAFGAMALVPVLFAVLPFVLFGGMLVGWMPFAAAFLILADGDPASQKVAKVGLAIIVVWAGGLVVTWWQERKASSLLRRPEEGPTWAPSRRTAH